MWDNKEKIVSIFMVLIMLSMGVKAIIGYPVLELANPASISTTYTKIGMSEINYTFDGSAGVKDNISMRDLNTYLANLIGGEDSAATIVKITTTNGPDSCYINLSDLGVKLTVRVTPNDIILVGSPNILNTFFKEEGVTYLIKIDGTEKKIDALVVNKDSGVSTLTSNNNSFTEGKCWSAKQIATPAQEKSYYVLTKSDWVDIGVTVTSDEECSKRFVECGSGFAAGDVIRKYAGDDEVDVPSHYDCTVKNVATAFRKTYVNKDHYCQVDTTGKECVHSDCLSGGAPDFPKAYYSARGCQWAFTIDSHNNYGCCPPDYPYYRNWGCWHAS